MAEVLGRLYFLGFKVMRLYGRADVTDIFGKYP